MFHVPTPAEAAPDAFGFAQRTAGGPLRVIIEHEEPPRTAGGPDVRFVHFGPSVDPRMGATAIEKTAGGPGMIFAGVIATLLVGVGFSTAFALYYAYKFLNALPKNCMPLMPNETPRPGWQVADLAVALPAAKAAFGEEDGPKFLQMAIDNGWRYQCAPGV